IGRVVGPATIAVDPTLAAEAAAAGRRQQGVWRARSSDHGTRSVFARAEASDITFFDAAVDRVADGLALLGSDAPKDQRRAAALGVLADPRRALDLYAAAAQAASGRDRADWPSDVTGALLTA